MTRKDPFWKSLVINCDEKLQTYDTTPGQDINQDYKTFKHNLDETVTSTFKHVKPFATILSAKIRSTSELRKLRKQERECFAKIKNEGNEERRKRLKTLISSKS